MEKALSKLENLILVKSPPFNYVTEACRESDGITTTGRMLYRNLKITSALDEIYGGICKRRMLLQN